MKILHTSDWHLGITLHNIPLCDQQEHFINTFIETVRTEKPDAVIISGDIFDTSVSNSEAIRLYNLAVNGVCIGCGVPLIIIAGNHDGAARLASCRELLKKSGLHITGKLTKDCEPVIIGNAAIYPVPYFNIDEVRYLYPDAEIKTYEDAFGVVCADIISKADKSKKNILAAHAFISGAELSDSNRSAILGTAQMVSADVLDGFDFAALGHIHRAQSVRENVCYCGSPLKYSVGEAEQEKSMLMLDTDDMSVRRIPVVPLHELRVIKGTYDELVEAAAESDDYIHIEITDIPAGLEMMSLFRRFYPNLISLRGAEVHDGRAKNLITADEVGEMNEVDILKGFFMEIHGMELEDEQIQLFGEAFEAAKKGSGLE